MESKSKRGLKKESKLKREREHSWIKHEKYCLKNLHVGLLLGMIIKK